jgi:hypothetical protein
MSAPSRSRCTNLCCPKLFPRTDAALELPQNVYACTKIFVDTTNIFVVWSLP